jgi:hypothetical protein
MEHPVESVCLFANQIGLLKYPDMAGRLAPVKAVRLHGLKKSKCHRALNCCVVFHPKKGQAHVGSWRGSVEVYLLGKAVRQNFAIFMGPIGVL